MSISEKFCLRWNDFQENVNTTFACLREDSDFSDVTLACEDGQQMEAHKFILAACSPFFKNLLKKNKHPHPLIYMRGVRSEDMMAILDFLYLGEAKVYQENLDSLLAIGEELNMIGLEGESTLIERSQTTPDKMKQTVKTASKSNVQTAPILDMFTMKAEEKNFKRLAGETENKESFQMPQLPDIEQTSPPTKISTLKSNLNNTDMIIEVSGDLDDTIKSLIVYVPQSDGQGKIYSCQVCGKQFSARNQTHLKNHIEANHIDGFSHSCNFCDKICR
jgi:hypothetical protein